MNEEPYLNCPICKQIDLVRKARAIYETDFSTTEYTEILPTPPGTNWAPLPVSRQSGGPSFLARRLSPPPKPTLKTETSASAGYVTWLLTAAVGFIILFSSSSASGASPALVCLGLFLVSPIIASIVQKNSVPQNIEQIKKENKDTLERWQRALHRWDQCYYCGRDGVVFIRGESNAVSPEMMPTILYQSTT